MKTIFLSFFFFSITVFSVAISAQEDPGTIYGDWTEFCDNNVGVKGACNISQTLIRPETKDLLLFISINYPAGSSEPIVFVTLPLGGLLAYPPQLKVGLEKPLDLAYQSCDVSGCTAAAVLSKEILAALNKEIQAIVKHVNRDRKALAVPVSLIGFSKGMGSIAPKSK